MADPAFPIAELGAPLVRGYSTQWGAVSERVAMLDGAPRYYQTREHPTEAFSLLWELTREQMMRLWAFWHQDLKRGALWFTMPLDGGLALGPGGAIPGGTMPRRVHFLGPPEILRSITHPGYTVTARVEAEDIWPQIEAGGPVI